MTSSSVPSDATTPPVSAAGAWPAPAPALSDLAATRPPPPHTPWIPIRSLGPGHRDRIARHLQALPEGDRYLRFGHVASDEQIQRYVDSLDFERDEVFGVFNRRLSLIALAHLAYPRPGAPGRQAAEFGGSVLPDARGRGYGGRLFEHAMLHARNRGLDALYIHALSENTTMLHIARRAGAVVQRDGGESEAVLRLPPDTLASRMTQWVGDSAAELDFQFKRQSHRMDRFIDAIGDLRQGLSGQEGQIARD